MAINYKCNQYKSNIENWNTINDIVNHTNLDEYLIPLNPSDTSKQNTDRNTAYKERAVFYALTEQTVNGMLGTIFDKLPTIEIPESLEYLKTNVDGRGNSIYQQSKKVTKNAISISRDGLFVSFPKIESAISKADIQAGYAVATIQNITADRVINWHEYGVGALSRLDLVVFTDTEETYIDYELKEIPTLRELYLDEGVYKERIWRQINDEWVAGDESIPHDHTGRFMTEIPFTFVGSVNNDSDVDNPNMLPMSKLNIGHFRNSADFEDTVWYAGQSQPWMSNVNQQHIDLMKENKMYVGSREMLAVPDGGSFGFESAPPNPLVRQAMIDKVEMMVSLGAKQIIPGGVAKTREQTLSENETKHSSMSMIAENVSDAYSRCLIWVGLFMGVTEEMSYSLNNDFIRNNSTPQELKEVILGFMAGSIPSSDYIQYMKMYGLFDENKPDEDYIEELEVQTLPDLGA